MRFIALEKMHRIHEGYRRIITLDGRNLLLLHHDDQIHIIENFCPHAGARFDNASIIGGRLRCPWHGMTFDICSGKAETCGLELIKYQPAYEQQSVGIIIE